jgi:ureidoglycolate lyase
MPLAIQAPNGAVLLEPKTLVQDTFHPFGTVIENPAPSLLPSPHLQDLPTSAVMANQGSALKYMNVTNMKNLYDSAPSQETAIAVMNMFVCGPRPLCRSRKSTLDGTFSVEILERHPFTSQTFIPLGLSPSEAKQARYLVIVAPTLPPSKTDENLPVPSAKDSPGRGLPDLTRMKAFIAKGSHAVTYGAGTWHAPMVVVGRKPIDFVVVQFSNGVALEDCQEVEWKTREGDEVMVAVPATHEQSKL